MNVSETRLLSVAVQFVHGLYTDQIRSPVYIVDNFFPLNIFVKLHPTVFSHIWTMRTHDLVNSDISEALLLWVKRCVFTEVT